MKTVILRLVNENMDAEDLAKSTYNFAEVIKSETDVNVERQEMDLENHQKGDGINFATLVLTFLSSGSAIALFNVFKSYASKDSAIKFEITKDNGEKIILNANNLTKTQFDKVLSIVDDAKE